MNRKMSLSLRDQNEEDCTQHKRKRRKINGIILNENIEYFIEELKFQMKAMDANRYATKKTIAQGMLDIALLTANASQLKYILQVGEQHQFYKLMLILISLSIVLQVNSVNIVLLNFIGMELL